MASFGKIRIWKPNEVWIFNNSTINMLQQRGHEVYAITVEAIIGASNGATEFDNAANVFDGTSTAAVLYAASSSANDANAAAGHVRQITINVVNENGDPDREVLNLDATDGTTDVYTTNKFQRIYSHYASLHGTGGGDAAGNIITSDDDVPTTTYTQITAASNESDGEYIWVPDGYNSIIENVTLVIADAALANAHDGAFIELEKISMGDAGAIAGECDTMDPVRVSITGGADSVSIKPQLYPDVGGDKACYCLKESYITAAETVKCSILFILYKTTRAGL